MREAIRRSPVEYDLHNWARWCNSGSDGGPPVQTQAASAEGRHIADDGQIWETQEDRPIPINVDRARIVQMVYDERLTPAERKVMQATYPHAYRYMATLKTGTRVFSTDKAARKLGVPLRIYAEMLARCRRLVSEALS